MGCANESLQDLILPCPKSIRPFMLPFLILSSAPFFLQKPIMNILLSIVSPTWALFLAVSFVTAFILAFYQRYQNGLARFPGPTLASFSDLWRFGYSLYNRHSSPNVSLHKRYGPVVRMGPRMLSFSTPEAARDIYSAGKHFKKVSQSPRHAI